MAEPEALLALNQREFKVVDAAFERMFPAEEHGPGAREIGAAVYLDRALAGAYREQLPTYRAGLAVLDAESRQRLHQGFPEAAAAEQDALLADLERGEIDGWLAPAQQVFFEMLRAHLLEGLFSDPAYGGNRDKLGWRVLGHPGVWLENSAEENLSAEPVTKGGRIQSLADVASALRAQQADDPEIPGFEPQRGAAPPADSADVVLVGVGGVGGFIAPVLSRAGLRVVGLEAGPWWQFADFQPDELSAAYYCRADLGPKFNRETPRWRRRKGEPTRDLTFSLGRMMNGVGGSVIHYGAWLRRFPEQSFRLRSYARERWGSRIIPEGCTVADWPISYDEMRPFYTEVEQIAGIAGDAENAFRPQDRDYPLPPTRPFRMGQMFTEAARAMGLHPHAAPVGMTTRPRNGFPEMRYTAWNNGFGSWSGDKWHPGLTCVREALATGNFDLRTGCRVTRIINGDGRARGVEYLDALGQPRVQLADTVILAAYVFENVRLLFLSGDETHPDGIGNRHGQLGRHFMTKMFPHVDGYFPDVVFNRHTGPAAQAVVLDDYLDASFDCGAHGFLGGSTLGAENQFLPIQISREILPPDVPRWGQGYKDHLRQWQHWGVVRMQPESLAYEDNFLDIDPHHRDRSGLGMPLVRVTYDLHENEHRLAEFMEGQCEDILRAMGASKTWRGPRFTGAGSSHDLGGCRMGDDPTNSVVDRTLRVHDTPGLYVFSGAVFPTCAGVNPTMTLWALSLWAAQGLVGRLQAGDER